MGDGGSAVVIEELTGDLRVVRLVGSAQPFRPTPLSVIQKVVTTYLPGNPEANQQVLGTQDPSVDWTGEWRRTLLGKTPVVVSDKDGERYLSAPMDLVDLFDDIVRSGQRVRVTWGAIDGAGIDRGNIVREGRIVSADWNIHRADIIEWKIKFEWAGRVGRAHQVTHSNDTGAVFSALQQDMNALALYGAYQRTLASIASIPNSASFTTLGQIESLLDTPKQLTDKFLIDMRRLNSQLDGISSIIKKTVNVPAEVVRSAVTIANAVHVTARKFRDTISAVPAELTSAKSNLNDVLRSAKYGWKAADLGDVCADRARGLQKQWSSAVRLDRPTAPADILGIHLVKRSDTMQSIAMKWYQDPSLSVEICKANKLPWHTVTPGKQTLVIPAVKSLASRVAV